ncbi:Androgen-induced 1 protein [Eufriesea mexicana]|uniref:androgen-induced gene 1 protein-like isoform X2 n=1 Tax=Eufriesea mexicana TaxID=516756 RepID=UPI00083BE314|nr:PREDICTED: androgen-induced gene 1 protein-like isoform X2 [Eufriesea mexicana]OAD58277.1 Androgen-induced 1 protein [Eufriesea mexicana]
MRDSLLIGFHIISCVQFSFGVYYDYTYVNVPSSILKTQNAFGGKFKYLTFWDAIIQAVYFFICVLNDCFGTNAVSPKKPSFIRKLKDCMHAILSFPIAMFVGITFWSLMFVDRELILPKALDPYLPWWLNHLMHSMIVVSIVIETILTPRKYPKRLQGLLGIITFVHIYLFWTLIIYYKCNVWVYPIMEVLSWPSRILFFIALISFSISLYFVGEAMDNFFWGNKYTQHQKSNAKIK